MNLKQALKKDLTKKELKLLPRAFDIIGNIAIFSEFPKELEKKEKIIGNKLIEINKNIKTVAKKTKQFSGIYRLRKLKIIAGKRTKTTIYKENNVILKLNIETCYFSSRLSTERQRIASLVKPKESVLVMFSGTGVYPIVISKNSKAKEIYGIEINPECHKFAKENVQLNKLTNIKLFQGDVFKVIPKIRKKFDRILMPLPKTAQEFLDLALKKARKGTIIHLYGFAHINDFPKAKKEIQKNKKVKLMKFIKCGQYSPRKYRVCFDLKVL